MFWYKFAMIYFDLVQCAICRKFLSSFPYSSKWFLNFRLSSTRLLINWFLIKKHVVLSFLIFRLPSTRMLIKWFLINKHALLGSEILFGK